MTAQPETQSLAAWILAHVEADEAAAKAYVNGLGEAAVWTAEEVGGRVQGRYGNEVFHFETHLDAAHFARHDPARVLAQCAAIRAVVALHRDRYGSGECASCADGWRDLTTGEEGHQPLMFPCPTLTALAGIWGGHEGAEAGT